MAVLAVAIPHAASADSAATPAAALDHFLITSTALTAAGTLTYRDLLVVPANTSADALTPTDIGGPSERGSTCYSLAHELLERRTDRAAYPVYVALGDATIAVPVTTQLRHDSTATDDVVTARGQTRATVANANQPNVAVNVLVQAVADVRDGRLQGATFDQQTSLGNQTRLLTRSSCMIQRIDAPDPGANDSTPANVGSPA